MTKFIKLIFTYSEKEDSNGDKSAESDNDSVRNESLESADDESDDGIEEQQGLESDEKSLDKEEEEDVILISDHSDTEGELSSPANEDLN